MMEPRKTAIICIGYQNDYFAEDGILRGFIEKSADATDTLGNTLNLLETVKSTDILLIQTPILFSSDYAELNNPVGILKAIRDCGAFQKSGRGSSVIDEIQALGDRIRTIPGKHGLNAFSNTDLGRTLEEAEIENVVLVGAVTSICIDSTGRFAHECGYSVVILSDCTCWRTEFEQEFYCKEVFPLYARVMNHRELCNQLNKV